MAMAPPRLRGAAQVAAGLGEEKASLQAGHRGGGQASGLGVWPLLVWGAAVIADSAQFSAAVTELAEPRYAGSILALQLALGLALTVASIRLVPVVTDAVGWRFALLPLAVGPLLGAVAMLRLRASPASRQLAGGRR